jgi:hypothetical protein
MIGEIVKVVAEVEKVKLDPVKMFGVEIEAYLDTYPDELATELRENGVECWEEDYNHYTRDYWKIVEDSTLNTGYDEYPFELVSPPLCGMSGLRDIERACEVLVDMGAGQDQSCGFHVHHDAGCFDLESWKILAKVYVKYEDTIDEFMDYDRRGDDHWTCHAMRRYGYSLERMFQCIDATESVCELSEIWGTRYSKLNLDAFDIHGTFEFRQHHATLDFSDMAFWISLTQGLMGFAGEHQYISFLQTPLPFESLMWTVGASAEVRAHFWNKYELLT